MAITAPTPRGFLFAHIDTGIPGARTVTRPGGGEITAAEGYGKFEGWLKLISDAITADHGSSFSFSTSTGLCTFSAGASGDFEWDRCGDLTGIARKPGVAKALSSGDTLSSFYIPRGAIWLMGAEYEEIELVREMQFDQFRWRRGYGYSWGGARVYRWLLTMHKEALEAFDAGWCASGKVTLQMDNASGITDSGTGYSGSLTGHVIGVEGQAWLGPARDVAQVSLIVAGDD